MSLVKELIVDAYGCEANLSDIKLLEKTCREAVTSVGATVAEVSYHLFQPHGITLSLILKESHCVMSTWPEHKLAIVNFFLCNDSMDAHDCWNVLEKVLRPSQVRFHTVEHRISAALKAA